MTKETEFWCFAGKHNVRHSLIEKSGWTKAGKPWHICSSCYTPSNRVKNGNKGSVKMGWNGVPSDKSLRRR